MRVSRSDYPGDFLIQHIFLIDEMLEVIVPFLPGAGPEVVRRLVLRRAFFEMIELDASLNGFQRRHVGFVLDTRNVVDGQRVSSILLALWRSLGGQAKLAKIKREILVRGRVR